MLCECRCRLVPEEDISPYGAGVTDGCEVSLSVLKTELGPVVEEQEVL